MSRIVPLLRFEDGVLVFVNLDQMNYFTARRGSFLSEGGPDDYCEVVFPAGPARASSSAGTTSR